MTKKTITLPLLALTSLATTGCANLLDRVEDLVYDQLEDEVDQATEDLGDEVEGELFDDPEDDDDEPELDHDTGDDGPRGGDTGEDTGHAPPHHFEPDLLAFSLVFGVSGGEVTGYSLDGDDEVPWVRVTFYDEDGDDCSWLGQLRQEAVLTLQDTFGGFEFSLGEHPAQPTRCTGFDPDVWGEDGPTAVLEDTRLRVVFEAFDTADYEGLVEAVEAAGYDYEEDWAPYLLGAQLSVGGSLSPNAYTWAWRGGPEMALTSETLQLTRTTNLVELPDQVVLDAASWWLVDASTLTD